MKHQRADRPRQVLLYLSLVAGLWLYGCGTTPETSSYKTSVADVAPTMDDARAYTDDRSSQTGVAAIRPVLVGVGRFDEARITDFRLVSRCRTAFTTANGTVSIDWSKVGNFAGHDTGDQVVIVIDDGTGDHRVSVPKATQPEPIGDAYALVDSGLSGIADACEPRQ